MLAEALSGGEGEEGNGFSLNQFHLFSSKVILEGKWDPTDAAATIEADIT